MNRFAEALKYVTVIFQMKTNLADYLKAIYFYKAKKEVKFPKARIRLKGTKFLTRKDTMDIVHISNFYERETTKFFIESRPKIFVDVGTHIGRFSILLAAKGSKVLSIEASRANFDQLNKNISLNNLKDKIQAVNIGCSDKNGEHEFYFGELNEGANSLEKIEGARVEKIKIRKLDDLLKDFNIQPEEVGLVKIDVEGAELNVLKGGENLLAKGAPVLAIEILNEEEEEKIKNFLKNFGFKNSRTIDSRNFIFEKTQQKFK